MPFDGHQVPPDDEEFWFDPPRITIKPLPEQLALWKLSRQETERRYVDAFKTNSRPVLRWLAKYDRYFLLTVVLRRGDARRNWLFARCREVEADPDDRLDLWAREHYKSTIITFAGIIQEIIKDPDITIGIFAHNRPLAKSFLSQIKREFEDNTLLRNLFPEIFYANPQTEAVKWSEDDGIVVRRKANPKEATIEAWGLVDGMPTGKHFRLRVYDDVVTEKSVTTPDMIRKTTEMFELSEDLGTHGGRCWMIGTRYHYGDTYHLIRQRGFIKERRYPATHDGTMEGIPVFLSQEDWEKKKSRSRSITAAQQLLNPLAGAEREFDIKDLQMWSVRPKRINAYLMCDPSKGAHATSDRTAISIIGVDHQRNKYWLDGWCHRMSLSHRWILISRLWKRWSNMEGVDVFRVGYEQFGMQTDIEYFKERMEIDKVHFPVTELAWPRQGPKSKAQRIQRLGPDVKMGRFRMPRTFKLDDNGEIEEFDPRGLRDVQDAVALGQKWRTAEPMRKRDENGRIYDPVTRFLEEFTFFPYAPFDDFLDSASRIYDMEPAPPQVVDEEAGRSNSTEPETYVDGS